MIDESSKVSAKGAFKGFFSAGNLALQQGEIISAIGNYVQALAAGPADILSRQCAFNLAMARSRYRASRQHESEKCVGVCCWDLGHNAAGRAHTLATIYNNIPETHVELLGGLFQRHGSKVWGPIRDVEIPFHTLSVAAEDEDFFERAAYFVAEHPQDIVHLIKPRFPNIIFGLLYKLLWGARVVVDVDDDELAFVGANRPLAVSRWLQNPTGTDPWSHLDGGTATRLAVGLVNTFDGVTAANAAFAERYGGEVVRHARDPGLFQPSIDRRTAARRRWGISQEKQVVLFLGTPRAHKGLLETAEALAGLKREELLFFIVGSFPPGLARLKAEIGAVEGLAVRFADDQPYERIPDILSCADLVVLLQDAGSNAARYQTPAKLTDALAMGLPVLAEITPGIEDLAALDERQTQITPVTRHTLRVRLGEVLYRLHYESAARDAIHSLPLFCDQLTLIANEAPLRVVLEHGAERVGRRVTLTHELRQFALLERLQWLTRPMLLLNK